MQVTEDFLINLLHIFSMNPIHGECSSYSNILKRKRENRRVETFLGKSHQRIKYPRKALNECQEYHGD